MKRVAIVGSGIAGLAAAQALAGQAKVTLFEAGGHFGGHANTVDVTLDGVTHGVDTGFLVFNHRTYPELVRLFDRLQVTTAASDMSFSVQSHEGLEWSGSDLNGVFAQRRNLLRPRFLRMLADILRFNRLATAIAERGADAELAEPIGDFLDRHGFGGAFRDWYFLPMVGCIWSCPTDRMLRFPIATMIRFCHNHGLMQVSGRPQWYTVRGGSREYVSRLLRDIPDARLHTPVRSVRRVPPGDGSAGVIVATDAGAERFDEVVLACHSDQSLALLADATPAEQGGPRCHPLPRQRSGAAYRHRRPAAPAPCLGSLELRACHRGPQRAGRRVPALPHQPAAAAALAATGDRLAQPRPGAPARPEAGDRPLRLQPPGVRSGRHRRPAATAGSAGPGAGLVLRRLDPLRFP